MSQTEERRITAGEVRVDQADGSLLPVIRGYALVFGALSEDLGGFREIIHPDAVQRTMREGIDLRALVDHNPERIIGRLSARTLRVRPDQHGFAVEIDPPNTTAGRDITESVRRRDVTGMSFAFRTMEDGDRWERRSDGQVIRTLYDIRISEVSPVSFPAYPDTAVAVRSLQRFQALPPPRSVGTLRRQLQQRMASWR